MFSLKNYIWSSARWRFDVTKDLNPASEVNSPNTEGEAGPRVLFVFLLWNKGLTPHGCGPAPTRVVELLLHDRKSGSRKKLLCLLAWQDGILHFRVFSCLAPEQIGWRRAQLEEGVASSGRKWRPCEVLASISEFTVSHALSPLAPDSKLLQQNKLKLGEITKDRESNTIFKIPGSVRNSFRRAWICIENMEESIHEHCAFKELNF